MAELNKLLKFSEVILTKKILAYIKIIKEEHPESETLYNYESYDKEQLANLCIQLDQEVKLIKDELSKKKELALEQQRLEEEEEREIKMAEKAQKEKFIIDNSIVDISLMDRLKFRFFNLSIFDPEDPEGLNPLCSPPFYETKEEQFLEELLNSSFRVYTANYNGESMSGKPDFMQKNLNKSFISIVEESQYNNMLFVSFRIIIKDGLCRYNSVWISNIKQDLSTIPDFDMFTFIEESKNNIVFKLLEDETLIEQIFAR